MMSARARVTPQANKYACRVNEQCERMARSNAQIVRHLNAICHCPCAAATNDAAAAADAPHCAIPSDFVLRRFPMLNLDVKRRMPDAAALGEAVAMTFFMLPNDLPAGRRAKRHRNRTVNARRWMTKRTEAMAEELNASSSTGRLDTAPLNANEG